MVLYLASLYIPQLNILYLVLNFHANQLQHANLTKFKALQIVAFLKMISVF